MDFHLDKLNYLEIRFRRNKWHTCITEQIVPLTYLMQKGLATLESLSRSTPIIATLTGGLQEQVTDGEKFFGIGIKPASKALIGSQQVPYIYEDRVSKKSFFAALDKMYHGGEEHRKELGERGRRHVLENYNFENFAKSWEKILTELYDKKGSWETRKDYKKWELIAV